MDITEETIGTLTLRVMGIMDNWELDSPQILNVLGLEGTVPIRALRKYRLQAGSLPYSPELAERLDHILGIADAMATSYPFNAGICAMWLRRPHRRFSQKAPLDIILSEGCDGLSRIRIELDCNYGWSVMEEAGKRGHS